MNALILSEATYPRHGGGAGRCAHLVAAGLVRRGHAVHLISATGDRLERDRIDGVEVHRVPTNLDGCAERHLQERVLSERFLSYLRDNVRLPSIDVIHDVGGFLSYFYDVARALRAEYAMPVIVHFQFLNLAYRKACDPFPRIGPFSPLALGYDAGFPERIQCYAVRIADLIVAPSYSEASLIRRLFRPLPGRVAVVPNPVDTSVFPTRPDRHWRHRLGADRSPVVLFAGRIDDAMKGADLLAEAFSHVLAARPDARLVTLATKASAARLISRLGQAVECLGWIADAGILARILSAVHVVVVPSRYEPFGLVGLEAMAAGVPVVATPVGGLKELVRTGYNGILLRHKTSSAWAAELADAVLALLNQPHLACTMGRRGRALAHREYRVETVARRIETLYRLVISRPRAPSGRAVLAPPADPERVRYAALVGSVGGPEAKAAVAGKPLRYHCASCTRSVVAETHRELVRLRAVRPGDGQQGEYGRWRRELEAATRRVCPAGLLQRAFLGAEGPWDRDSKPLPKRRPRL